MTETFKKITVVGTGTLGFQIAMLASNAGCRVIVFDQQAGAFDAMMEKLDADIRTKQIEPFIPFDRWPACSRQIKQIERLDEVVKDADLVIEAVLENMQVKQDLFRQLDGLCHEGTILTSNTSSMPNVAAKAGPSSNQSKLVI